MSEKYVTTNLRLSEENHERLARPAAVKVAKEQASKAGQRLAAARPARTTTVAPPTGDPPGPVLAQVTNNHDGDEKPGSKPDTEPDTATAEPPQ